MITEISTTTNPNSMPTKASYRAIIGQTLTDPFGVKFVIEDFMPDRGRHGMWMIVGPTGRIAVLPEFLAASFYESGPKEELTADQRMSRRYASVMETAPAIIDRTAAQRFFAVLLGQDVDRLRTDVELLTAALAAYEQGRIAS